MSEPTPPSVHEDLIIDINVFIGAMKKTEARQAECAEFLKRVHAAHARGDVTQRQPPLFVLELFAVMNRTHRDLEGGGRERPRPAGTGAGRAGDRYIEGEPKRQFTLPDTKATYDPTTNEVVED